MTTRPFEARYKVIRDTEFILLHRRSELINVVEIRQIGNGTQYRCDAGWQLGREAK